MGIIFHKQRGMPALTGIAKLSIVGFLVAISAAFVETVWALYMDSFVHSEVIVGFISAALALVSFFSFFIFIPIIEKTNKAKLFSYSLLAFAVTYILFAINTKFYIFVILAFITTIIYTLKMTSFGIIVKDKSPKKRLSAGEGLVYTVLNTAWVIGPLIAGFIANRYNISTVFVLSAIFIFLSFIFFKASRIRDANIKKKVDKDLLKNFTDFFKDKKRIIAYIVGGGVNIWWIFMYLFMPLHIVRSGLNDLWVGYFLFAVAFPLILLEYPFSNLTRKIGFKKIFKIGFLTVALISFLCFFIENIYVVLGILTLASVGMAMIEPTTEAYFFKISSGKNDTRFYGPYNTTIDANGFIGKISASCVLLFLPFKFLFILFGIFMLIMFFFSHKTKNIIESRER